MNDVVGMDEFFGEAQAQADIIRAAELPTAGSGNQKTPRWVLFALAAGAVWLWWKSEKAYFRSMTREARR
jgi:hypothetical protein